MALVCLAGCLAPTAVAILMRLFPCVAVYDGWFALIPGRARSILIVPVRKAAPVDHRSVRRRTSEDQQHRYERCKHIDILHGSSPSHSWLIRLHSATSQSEDGKCFVALSLDARQPESDRHGNAPTRSPPIRMQFLEFYRKRG